MALFEGSNKSSPYYVVQGETTLRGFIQALGTSQGERCTVCRVQSKLKRITEWPEGLTYEEGGEIKE